MSTFSETLQKCGIHTYPLDIPIDANARRSIDFTIGLINEYLECDWDEDCEKPDCTEDNPLCRPMEYRHARKRLLAIVQPIHRSLSPDRLGNAAEDIFLRRWQEENQRERGLNSGYGLLELLLTPSRLRSGGPQYVGQPPYYVAPVSQRDAEVAASVVQWLGTSCGLSFMRAAEREIDEARVERVDMDGDRFRFVCGYSRVLPTYENLARQAALRAVRADDPKFGELVNSIVAAIQASHKNDSVPGAC